MTAVEGVEAGGAARALPGAGPRSRWLVRARRQAEGGPAALTMQRRPDGLLALLVDGQGRGGCLLDDHALVRLERAVRSALGRADEHPGRRRRPVAVPTARVPARPVLQPAEEGRGPTRIGGRIVLDVAVHVLMCGFVPAMELAVSDVVLGCAGCGCAVWAVDRDDVEGAAGPDGLGAA